MKENKLVDLSKQFAVDIVNLCTEKRENRKGNVLINQLLRSGTSIGANIKEGIREINARNIAPNNTIRLFIFFKYSAVGLPGRIFVINPPFS